MLTKTELRKSLLQTRKSLSPEAWRDKSDRLCNNLQKSPLFIQAKTILAYFSFRQEPDLSSIFTIPKTWGFPRCVGKDLSWHAWRQGDALRAGTYGILEPLPDAPQIENSEVDLILVPAVGCDVRGYRLGYGGGYYDRMLNLPEWRSKIAIGTIFEFALLPQLPVDSWDQPLHGICTESSLAILQQKS
ncbi:MAG: 5-formyltetrahydrofolate cyclo-ligase [Oscillatoriales cyanobacterium RU_3_3]|nr:5-formyltetrahydrofolate cyclo-ligase [Microcoleus sp. SU_5_6]NJM62962.1 5-formyltetrahydrofolate cyclo-ligase [Oscillatoriales cyanobacterium RU_3_3]